MRALRGWPEVQPLIVPSLGREISLFDDLRAFGRILFVLRRYRPHIVHTHLAKAGLLGRIAARAAGVPVVLHTFHGNVLRGYFDPLRSRVFLALERALAGASTRVIAISPRQAVEIEGFRIARPPKLVQLPVGLELGPFLRATPGRLRAELGLSPHVALIGTVARLVPIKGVDVFLEAAARIRDRRADSHFVVVGDGELRTELEVQARRLAIDRQVHFLGWRSDLPEIYADCDVVTLTSHNEGTPISVIEALAAARAVVATAVGGVPDILTGENGVLVPSGDAAAVSRAVLDLLDDVDLRRQLGQRGRQRVHPEFDISTLVRGISALYEELLGPRMT